MPATTPRVRVVVVTHNAREVTLRCLGALERTGWAADRLEVVLVDNASSDGVVEEVRHAHPAVTVISSSENEGFGRACNRAMQDLSAIDHVALVNNDAIPEPGWLAPLVDALEADAGLGAVSPKVLLDTHVQGVVLAQAAGALLTVSDLALDDEPAGARVTADERFHPASDGSPAWSTTRPEAGFWWPVDGRPLSRVALSLLTDRPVEVSLSTRADRCAVVVDRLPTSVDLALPTEPESAINSVGGVLYEGWFGGDRGYLELDRGQYDEPAEVFSWSGAAVLLRAGYLHDVGLFNPGLFLYYEDFELSWRGRLRGWRYRTVPDSVVRHEHGHTTGIGSARFRAWEERSRWTTLVELAPWPVAARAAGGGLRRAVARREGMTAGRELWIALRGRRRLAPDRRSATDIETWIQPRPDGS